MKFPLWTKVNSVNGQLVGFYVVGYSYEWNRHTKQAEETYTISSENIDSVQTKTLEVSRLQENELVANNE